MADHPDSIEAATERRGRVVDSEPQPGFFRKRAYSHGPWLPARIFRTCSCSVGGGDEHNWTDACDRNPPMQMQVMGYPVTTHAISIADVWAYWHEIDHREYLALLTEAAWNGDDE